MKQFVRRLIPRPLTILRSRFLDIISWKKRRYAPPSPAHVKRAVLLRNGIPGATWIETGTYLGETTHFLSGHSKHVYSIEPEPALFKNAVKRFKDKSNVSVLNGLSENIFPKLMSDLSGEVNFWLDGHFSLGITHKGPRDTPISDELESIQKHLAKFTKLAVLIDDIHCFNPTRKEYADYPPLDYLVDWARRNGLAWHIEHDIFIARK